MKSHEKAVYVTCNENGLKKHIQEKDNELLSNIVVKGLKIEINWTILCMKHVNQPVMNGPQKTRIKMTKKSVVLEKEEIIMKKEMENNTDVHVRIF